MCIYPIYDQLSHLLNVMRCHAHRVSENFGNQFRDADLINAKSRIRRDNCASREVDSFPGQISSESSLLAFETLNQTARWFLWLHVHCETREFAVDVYKCDPGREVKNGTI